MVDVRELIRYNETVRHRYFDVLSKLRWEEFVRNREASFHSLRNVFIHVLNAVDWWLDVLQNEKEHSTLKYDDYKHMDDVHKYMEQVEARVHKYIESLQEDGLRKTYKIKKRAGEGVEVTAEDILVHVFEEEVHHRGELICLLWQMNVEPPPMGWYSR